MQISGLSTQQLQTGGANRTTEATLVSGSISNLEIGVAVAGKVIQQGRASTLLEANGVQIQIPRLDRAGVGDDVSLKVITTQPRLTVQVAAASSTQVPAEPTTLQPGQQVVANVVQRLSSQTVELEIQGELFEAPTPPNVSIGGQLRLEVEQLSPQLSFRVIESEPGLAPAAQQLLREKLADAQPIGSSLRNVVETLQRVVEQLDVRERPPELSQLQTTLAKLLPSADAATPQAIAQFLEDGGQNLEAKLARLVTTKTDSPPSTSSTKLSLGSFSEPVTKNTSDSENILGLRQTLRRTLTANAPASLKELAAALLQQVNREEPALPLPKEELLFKLSRSLQEARTPDARDALRQFVRNVFSQAPASTDPQASLIHELKGALSHVLLNTQTPLPDETLRQLASQIANDSTGREISHQDLRSSRATELSAKLVDLVRQSGADAALPNSLRELLSRLATEVAGRGQPVAAVVGEFQAKFQQALRESQTPSARVAIKTLVADLLGLPTEINDEFSEVAKSIKDAISRGVNDARTSATPAESGFVESLIAEIERDTKSRSQAQTKSLSTANPLDQTLKLLRGTQGAALPPSLKEIAIRVLQQLLARGEPATKVVSEFQVKLTSAWKETQTPAGRTAIKNLVAAILGPSNESARPTELADPLFKQLQTAVAKELQDAGRPSSNHPLRSLASEFKNALPSPVSATKSSIDSETTSLADAMQSTLASPAPDSLKEVAAKIAEHLKIADQVKPTFDLVTELNSAIEQESVGEATNAWRDFAADLLLHVANGHKPVDGTLSELKLQIHRWLDTATASKAPAELQAFAESVLAAVKEKSDPQNSLHHDLKANLLRSVQYLESLDKSSPLTQLLQPLREQLDNIESQQLQNVVAHLNDGAYQIQIPLFEYPNVATAYISVDADEQQTDSLLAGEKAPYNVFLSLDLTTLGAIRIDAHVGEKKMWAILYSDRPSTTKLLQETLPELRQGLASLGFREALIVAKPLDQLRPEQREKFSAERSASRPLPTRLVDVKG